MNNSNTNKEFNNPKSENLEWKLIQDQMKSKLGSDIYESWLKKIDFVEEINNYVLLAVPTRFIRDWITSRYLDQILQSIKSYKKEIIRIEFKIVEKKEITTQRETGLNQPDNQENISFIKDSYLQYNRIDPNKRFENFITGSSNKLAYEASLKVSENISYYNPLYIYGGVGMGKTHLLNSIGLELKKNNKVMFISAERFMYQFVKSIKSNDMVKFKEYFRSTDILLIDDIQFMNGKEAMQEEFFHTFNALLDKGSQIIISADRPPLKLDRVQERIKSRLSGGLIIDIDVPDLELKKNIISSRINHIQNQFKEHVNISEDVINFIASEAKTNIRELIGVLNRVIAFSRLHKRLLSINDCKNILKDVFNQAKIVTVDKIQNTVSNYFNISLGDMLSQRRSRPLARPRQIAMFLAKRLTTRSLPEIGRRFANRDHTTVIHAVKTITKLSEKDEEMKKNLIQLRSLLLEN